MASRNVGLAMRATAAFASAALVFGLMPTQALAESVIELSGNSAEYGSDDSSIVVEDYEPIAVEGEGGLTVEGGTSYGYNSYDQGITVEGSDGIVVEDLGDYSSSSYTSYESSDASGLLVAQADKQKYTVEFDAKGGSPVPTSQEIEEGQYITPVTDPIKDGWTFAGWYEIENPTAADTPFDFLSTPITSAKKLYAGWKADLSAKVYDRTSKQNGRGGTVAINSGTASADPKETLFEGEQVTLTAQADTDYRFIGWSTNASDPANNIVSEEATYDLTFTDPSKMPIAVFGEMVTITYDVNGGAPGPQWKDSEQVDYGSSTIVGTVPTSVSADYATAPKGGKFAGFEVNVAGSVYTYAPGDAITVQVVGPTTIKYLWKLKAKVTFVDDEGKVLKNEAEYALGTPLDDIAPNDAAEKKAETSSDAQYTFKFVGWSPNDTVVEDDAVYEARYSKTTNKYEVKFVNDSGTVLQKMTLEYGKTPKYTGMTPAKAATSSNTYEFTGWSPSIQKVTGPATYTAQFKAVPKPTATASLKFRLIGGGELNGKTGEYIMTANVGETITLPEPTRDGFTFRHWFLVGDATESAKGTYAAGSSYTVTGSKDFIAMWAAAGGSGSSDGTTYSSADDGTDGTDDTTRTTSTITSTSSIGSAGTTGTTTGTGTTRTTSTIGSSTTTGTRSGAINGTTSGTSTSSTIGSPTSSTTTGLSQTGDPQARTTAQTILFAISGALLLAAGFELHRLRTTK